jgi:hypothetical protein
MSGRPLEYDELELERPPAPTSMPPLCLRRLQMPERHDCSSNCPGMQPDGSCLCTIVMNEREAGREPIFEIDKDGFWCLAST